MTLAWHFCAQTKFMVHHAHRLVMIESVLKAKARNVEYA